MSDRLKSQLVFVGLLIPFVVGCVVACGQVGPPRATDNPSIDVNFMFEYDGCKVYRFLDWNISEYGYYSDCRGGPRIQ